MIFGIFFEEYILECILDLMFDVFFGRYILDF